MKASQKIRLYRTTEIVFLAIIAIAIIEAINVWETDKMRAGIFILFAGFAAFRYFYSRKERARLKQEMND
ncbi:MAG: hypothetical protein HWD92_06610 [Flavobacteriia bacterium]|nr:hypothetical protein [Flavobacteriia bacterium]